MHIEGVSVRTALSVEESKVKIRVREDYDAASQASKAMQTRLDSIAPGGRWHGIDIKLSTDLRLAFSDRRLNLAWFKAGYLSIFWFLGYEAILNTSYDAIRKQLHDPGADIVRIFVGGRPRASEKRLVTLWYVYEPWQVFLVYFEGFPPVRDAVVLMPAPKDSDLAEYTRAVTSIGPGVRLASTGFPPDQRERGNSGLVLVSDNTGNEHLVY